MKIQKNMRSGKELFEIYSNYKNGRMTAGEIIRHYHVGQGYLYRMMNHLERYLLNPPTERVRRSYMAAAKLIRKEAEAQTVTVTPKREDPFAALEQARTAFDQAVIDFINHQVKQKVGEAGNELIRLRKENMEMRKVLEEAKVPNFIRSLKNQWLG